MRRDESILPSSTQGTRTSPESWSGQRYGVPPSPKRSRSLEPGSLLRRCGSPPPGVVTLGPTSRLGHVHRTWGLDPRVRVLTRPRPPDLGSRPMFPTHPLRTIIPDHQWREGSVTGWYHLSSSVSPAVGPVWSTATTHRDRLSGPCTRTTTVGPTHLTGRDWLVREPRGLPSLPSPPHTRREEVVLGQRWSPTASPVHPEPETPSVHSRTILSSLSLCTDTYPTSRFLGRVWGNRAT